MEVQVESRVKRTLFSHSKQNHCKRWNHASNTGFVRVPDKARVFELHRALTSSRTGTLPNSPSRRQENWRKSNVASTDGFMRVARTDS